MQKKCVTAEIVAKTKVTALKAKATPKVKPPSNGSDFNVVYGLLGLQDDLFVQMNGYKVSRQTPGTHNGKKSIRLRFSNSVGYAIIAINKNGECIPLPGGKITLCDLKKLATDALHLLCEKFKR